MADDDAPRRGLPRDALLWLALLGAGSANLGSLVFTQDRYYGTTAQADFALRDTKISEIRADLERIERRIERLDADHPPAYLTDLIRDIEQRVRELEGVRLRNAQ